MVLAPTEECAAEEVDGVPACDWSREGVAIKEAYCERGILSCEATATMSRHRLSLSECGAREVYGRGMGWELSMLEEDREGTDAAEAEKSSWSKMGVADASTAMLCGRPVFLQSRCSFQGTLLFSKHS